MLKRIFDCSIAFLLIILLSPVFIIVSCLIKLKLGSPIFFIQTRPGLNCKAFNLIKFRTMMFSDSNETDDDSHRLTRFGAIIRALSIDELPELWNVLKGDMSLVGPRPLLMEYLPLYNSQQLRRQEVKPGITGWAQVNGRNAISWDAKFAFDLWYVDNHSFLLDLKILIITVKKVFIREGISSSGHVTTEKFTGNNK